MLNAYSSLLSSLLIAVEIVGIMCWLYLLTQWRRYQGAGKKHYWWRWLWIGGCLTGGLIPLVILLPILHFLYGLAETVCSLLWITAFVAFRRARSQKPIPLPRYDEPKEGVWPPPPTNPL